MPHNLCSPMPLKRIIVSLALLLFFLQPCYSLAFAMDATYGATDTSLVTDLEGYVTGLFNKIKEKNRFVTALTDGDLGTLPVGLVREINGKTYVIAIDSARMTSTGATFSAYFRFTFPGTQSELVFGGKNIAFTPGGISAGTGTKLVMLKEKRINVNDHLDLIFPGDGSNFVEWDCNGFKDANLSGVFEFDKGMLRPQDTNTDILRASLQVNVRDLNNIMATVDIPAFRIKGLEDFGFRVKNAVVDMSDIANPAGIKLSKDMLVDPGSPLLWRGFYLQQLEVDLPSQLATKNGPPKVTVSDFILDDQGVSGSITADHIVKLGDASAGGWPLSIDKVGLTFSKNKLNGGEMGGQLRVGFLGDDPLDYDAAVSMRGDDTYYSFAVNTTADKEFKFFAGTITLGKDSRIELTKTDKDFLPVATLNGKVTLNKSVLNINKVTFQDIVLSTKSPYVHSGTFDFSNSDGGSKMSGFPVGFDNLFIGISEGKIGIGATVRLAFMNSSDKGFAAATSFVVTAKQEEEVQTITVNGAPVEKTTTHWSFDKVQINDIELSVKVMAFQMHGIITLFDNHPVYGNGFRGFLEFSIPGPIPKAKATAYFGSKDDYRYWHVDAYIGITIPVPPMLQITGLMGGMSYHMERPSQFDPYDTRNSLDKEGGIKELNEIFQYIPVKEAGLGFMGGVSLALVQQMVVNVNVALEVQFGTDGGFRYAQFDGAGYVMHLPIKALNKSDAEGDDSAPLWVQFKMRYDNVNSTFDASFKTYINIVGVLKGIHERGLAGEAALHIGPDDWWFYIGRPSEMFGLSILGLAEVQSYFMMGSKVEDMPALPTEVSELFDDINTDFMATENSMKTGGGFGFGIRFRVGFKFDYGVYGEFAVGAGSDILLRDYGEAKCKGSNSVIGFNGWYASGQAYVFLKGEVGIRVKVFRKKRSFIIAQLAAAVLLQAKAPNPAWFRGAAAVKYSVLGGLIKGNSSIKVELGSQCEIMGAKELEIQVISDLKPGDQSTDVSVFATPQVAFNYPVAKPFSMMNEYDEVATYRIQLDELKLMNDGAQINGITEVAADGGSASLTLRDILPAVSNFTTSAKVHIERQNGGSWDALKNESNAVDYEVKNASFKTGEAPDYIPWENVAYVYPVKRQYHFLPKEYNKGYIKLKRGQPDLFVPVDKAGKKWKITASMNPAQGQPLLMNLTYDESTAQANFDFPANMAKETIYTLSIVRHSADGEAAADNVTSVAKTDIGAEGDTTTITEAALKGNATSALSKEVISYAFRTSMYSNFVEKMNAGTGAKDLWDIATNNIAVIGQQFNTDESFDQFEIGGDGSLATKPLINLRAGLNNSWLQDKLLPLLYNGYPYNSAMKISRDTVQTGGVPPLEAIRLYNGDASLYKLEDGAISDGYAQPHPGGCRFMYYVPFVANDDYHELLDKAGRLYIDPSLAPANIGRLMISHFPDLDGNINYPVELQYRLPGNNQITSTVTRNVYYKL
ncbi:hypothetical protein F0L74_09460 [Chitinophaga agrisoli]|uniref:Uncharacterized protein n=1 Tax=Chitinophaga agrisoli TaxID=2607653 RepID=A0A5B2VVD5_9BACT|nr:hypothetical protein [Chitinophaga agrisoli]KAA2242744.1 hypothetical protein F0L74_09460 [Chitinophaga agrisoli]